LRVALPALLLNPAAPESSRSAIVSVFFDLPNARGLRSTIALIAAVRSISCAKELAQSRQLQVTPHTPPAAKQSQYNFKHREFLQLHAFNWEPPLPLEPRGKDAAFCRVASESERVMRKRLAGELVGDTGTRLKSIAVVWEGTLVEE
jgi:hypothetical protein